MALLYYARARNVKKVKDVLEMLMSHCLVQSISFPSAALWDERLGQILLQPSETLGLISQVDPAAAEILATNMSGYATLRKFYDLRDEEVNQRPTLRTSARKKAAAASLLSVIASSANNIEGGLYDGNSAVVPVNCLMVLLGEAMVFVDRRSSQISTICSS